MRGFSKVTRGERGVDLMSPPAAPTLLPGYVRTVPTSPPSYVYKWEHEGRFWPIRMYRRSVQVSAPTPRMRRDQVPGAASIQDRWTDYASKVIHKWAEAGGVVLGRDRHAIRRQSAVELEVATLPRQDGALSPNGTVEINGTPRAGTMETTSEDVAEQVENLPFTIPAQQRAIADSSIRIGQAEAKLGQVIALLGKVAVNQDVGADVQMGLTVKLSEVADQATQARRVSAAASASTSATAYTPPPSSPYDGGAYS